MKAQSGVGLVEVLVALLLLAVGVLGFTALQVRAAVATEEANKRGTAMAMLTSLAESMRTNTTSDLSQAVADNGVKNYTTATAANKNCMTNACTSADKAADDLWRVGEQAKLSGISIAVQECKGISNQKRACLIAAWDKTTTTTCLNSSGKYTDESTCLVLEAYPL